MKHNWEKFIELLTSEECFALAMLLDGNKHEIQAEHCSINEKAWETVSDCIIGFNESYAWIYREYVNELSSLLLIILLKEIGSWPKK